MGNGGADEAIADSVEGLSRLLAGASSAAVRAFADRLANYLNDLGEFRPTAPHGYRALSALADRARRYTETLSEESTDSPDYDHDYSDWHRLARSLWFNWGDSAPGWTAAAMAPTYWCANAVLANSDRLAAFRMAEVGAGTGRLTYEVARYRPNAAYWVGDVSIESLVLALALYSGITLDVPRRTSFDQSETGLTWFQCTAPTPLTATSIDFAAASIPNDHGFHFIVACNSLSLFPDPMQALEDLVARLAPGGWIVVCDLYCWRVETPAPRRIRGPSAVIDALIRLGCVIESVQHGLPYSEDWGFERTYVWASHAISARRG
jgi:SAM-dependent methyltransferase